MTALPMLSTRGSLCAKARPARYSAAMGSASSSSVRKYSLRISIFLSLPVVAAMASPTRANAANSEAGSTGGASVDASAGTGDGAFLDPAEREGQFHLVFLAQGPSFDPPRPQVRANAAA